MLLEFLSSIRHCDSSFSYNRAPTQTLGIWSYVIHYYKITYIVI